MRLIDAEALIKRITVAITLNRFLGVLYTASNMKDVIDQILSSVLKQIETTPTVDAVPVSFIEYLYKQAQEYRDQCEKHSQQWKVANDQAIGVGSVLLAWAERKEK